MQKYLVDIVVGLFLLAFSALLFQQLEGIPIEGVILPKVVLWTLVILSCVLIVQALIKRDKEKYNLLEGLNVGHFFCIACIFVVSVYTSLFFSFLLTIFFLNVSAILVLLEQKNTRMRIQGIVYSLGITVFIYAFFTKLMNIYFPENILPM